MNENHWDFKLYDMKTLGMITFKNKSKKFRFQFYWPSFTLTKRELYFNFPIVFRLLYPNKTVYNKNTYWGIGGQIFGFGVGMDYEFNKKSS